MLLVGQLQLVVAFQRGYLLVLGVVGLELSFSVSPLISSLRASLYPCREVAGIASSSALVFPSWSGINFLFVVLFNP